ncbi:MAG: L-threonylcarbamoyladenylate synthase [Spirochaetota bacterium]
MTMKKPDDSRSSKREAILEAARAIRSGRLVVFPTETVYGLGADAFDADAVAGIFAAKRRPADNPLIVHVADLEDLERVTRHASSVARDLFARFAPGPLTLVLPAHRDLAPAVTAGLSTVAVRFPAHSVAIELLRACARPIAAPSANRSGEPSPTTVEMARASLGAAVGVYLDGGPCRVGLESTVASVSDEAVTILRPGAVTADDIRAALSGVRVEYATVGASEPSPSPGLRHRHYQPRAEVLAVEPLPGAEARVAGLARPVAVIGRHADVKALNSALGRGGESPEEHSWSAVREAADIGEYARNLYRWFVELDTLGVKTIVAVMPPADGIGLALRDRLERASGGN